MSKECQLKTMGAKSNVICMPEDCEECTWWIDSALVAKKILWRARSIEKESTSCKPYLMPPTQKTRYKR